MSGGLVLASRLAAATRCDLDEISSARRNMVWALDPELFGIEHCKFQPEALGGPRSPWVIAGRAYVVSVLSLRVIGGIGCLGNWDGGKPSNYERWVD